jgi:hypothetical protein
MMLTRSPDRSPRRNPRRTTAALALFVIVTLTGCTRALDDGASTIAPSNTPAPDVPEGDALATDDPDPVRVLLAAVVLTTGDFEGYVAGTSLFDLAGAPDHLEQRRRRYRAMSHPAFDEHSRSQDAIERLNEATFAHGLAVLLDHLETLAKR